MSYSVSGFLARTLSKHRESWGKRTFVSIALGLLLLFLPFQLVHASDQSTGRAPTVFKLDIKTAPKDVWNKKRLVASVQDGALFLKDAGEGPFADASFWQVEFKQKLPFGRKEFSFTVEVGGDHKPLWREALLQPIINGKEGEPAVNLAGAASFEKLVLDDGKGFLPATSGRYVFGLQKSDRILQSFAFMTAAAEGYKITLKDFQVAVWPEADRSPKEHKLHASALPYSKGEAALFRYEWPVGSDVTETTSVQMVLKGPSEQREVDVKKSAKPSSSSGTFVSEVEIDSLSEAGTYSISIKNPSSDGAELVTEFSTGATGNAIKKLRDEAWGAFYWITDNKDGPYPTAHKQDVAARVYGDDSKTQDIRGGWFDAGDYGKYSVNGGFSVSLMLLTGLLAPDVLDHTIDPITGRKSNQDDWLTIAEAQLEWLIKMQREDGAVYHKAATQRWPGMNVRPEEDDAIKWLMPVSSTAAAQFAAALSLASQIYSLKKDEASAQKAKTYLSAAKRAIDWLEKNPKLTMIKQRYNGHQYGGPYDDDSDADERFFALAAYAAATKNHDDVAKAATLISERSSALAGSGYETNWQKVDLLGIWSLKTVQESLSEEEKNQVDKVLEGASKHWRGLQERSHWSLPMEDDASFPWGSNGVLATIGWHWTLWYKMTGDQHYEASARKLLHWFFGMNPLGQTYVTGSLGRSIKQPHFRPWTSGAIKLPAGFVVGGPNSGDMAGDPLEGKLAGKPPMAMFADKKESYATNEVAINWQSAWALYLSLLAAPQR